MSAAPTIHLVDATYELFRAYFGAPPRTAPDGREVGATRGLALSLLYLLREERATHVACATDHVIRSFRNRLWPGYKTDEGMDPALYGQFQIAEDVMRAMGFVVWPMVEHEADDALATGVHRFGDACEHIVVCTVDKDLAQTVDGSRVIMSDRRRKTTMDEAGVVAKFGVAPRQIPDLLALVGDTADGYPGIPGFGMKSAAAALVAFGRIEDIPEDPAKWPKTVRGAARLAETLRDQREHAMLFKDLATLRLDVPMTETVADLEWRGPTAELAPLSESLGFGDLFERAEAVARARAR
ncbi:MAG TPA: 5'-3' exonuclease H3TH domain-containing protein [Polyangiaceae bacterium]|nr:5'-3' exonuclease H3TH domain-containing protein [Polyangiaceae bacterium]